MSTFEVVLQLIKIVLGIIGLGLLIYVATHLQ